MQSMPNLIQKFLYCLSLFLVSACSTYNPPLPILQVPNAWKEQHVSDDSVVSPFWQLFEDPILKALEEEAVIANSDIKIAYDHLLQTCALLSQQHANRLPQINLSADFMNDETLLNPRSFGSPRKKLVRVEQQEYSILANFSYELDLWGKLKKQEESFNFHLQAAEWEYEFIYQTVVTEVAMRYYTICSLSEEIQSLADEIKLRKDVIFFNQCRTDAGLCSHIDLSLVTVDLALIEVAIEQAKNQYSTEQHALANLLGKPASCWTLELERTSQPTLSVPSVLPAEMLIRRADVQQALALVSAGRADVDVALRLYFPSFSLTVAAGVASPFLSNLFEWEGRYWGYIFDMFAPLYDGGRLNSNLLAAKAQFVENFHLYIKTVNNAFKDVEDALADFHFVNLQWEAQIKALNAAKDADYLSREQFKSGLISYLVVAETENLLLTMKQREIALRREKILAWIRLMKALGIQREDCPFE